MKRNGLTFLLMCFLFLSAFATETETASGTVETKMIVVPESKAVFRWLFPSGYTGENCIPATDKDGNLLFVGNETVLYCLSPQREVVWSYQDRWHKGSNPVICGLTGEIAIVNADNRLIILSRNGKPLGTSQLAKFPESLYVTAEGRISCDDGMIKTFDYDPITQMVKTITALPFSAEGAFAPAPRRAVCYITPQDSLACVRENGEPYWEIATGKPTTAFVYGADQTLYFGTDTGCFYGITTKGQIAMRIEGWGGLRGSPVIDNKSTLYLLSENRLRALDTHGTILWESVFSEKTGNPILTKSGKAYLFTKSGTLFEVQTDTGNAEAVFDAKVTLCGEPLLRDGALYVMTDIGLMALEVKNQELAPSAWPMLKRDGFRSGSAFSPTISRYPSAALKPSPKDRSRLNSVSLTLRWESTETVALYDIYFGSAEPLPLLVENLDTLYYPVENLKPRTKYYWKVVTRNAAGEIESPVWTFTTR